MQGYLVWQGQLTHDPTPAERIGDRARVALVRDSYRPTEERSGDGRVVVRGLGRHSKRWLAGAALTAIGLTFNLVGAAVIVGATDLTWDARIALGGSLTLIGSVGSVFVGPPLWIAGARARPVEVAPP